MRKLEIPAASLPAEGLMLWEVLCTIIFEDDPEMTVIGTRDEEHFFVLANNEQEAIKKSELLVVPFVNMLRRRNKKDVKVSAHIVDLESLIPARNSKYDGGRGRGGLLEEFISKVELSLYNDRKKFRLGVFLIPEEE